MKKGLFATFALLASIALVGCGKKPCEKHEYGKWEVTTPATCTAEGEKVRACKVCGHKDTQTIEKADHTWDAGVETKPATCSEPGEKLYTCTVCKIATKTEVITAEHDMQPYEYTQGEGAVAAVVTKCSRDNHYEIDFNAYDSAAVLSVSGDNKGDYVKLSKQVAADGTGSASTIEWKFYSPVALKGRFWIAITGNTSGIWDRSTRSGSHALYYTYNDTTTNINTWKNEVTFNGSVVDFDNAKYTINGEEIPFADLVYSDFGELASSSGTPILVPMPEMNVQAGENTLSFKRLTGYAFNMHTFTFKGDVVA